MASQVRVKPGLATSWCMTFADCRRLSFVWWEQHTCTHKTKVEARTDV